MSLSNAGKTYNLSNIGRDADKDRFLNTAVMIMIAVFFLLKYYFYKAVIINKIPYSYFYVVIRTTMFNADPSSKPVNAKLPKEIVIMIEKNNLVMAIKTLAADENISMDEAKVRIDAYETQLKVKQQQNLSTIANKQGIPPQAISFDREPETEDESDKVVKDHLKANKKGKSFKNLQDGVDGKLNDLGYKKPLLPYWTKRLLVIAVVMAGLFWILWQVFG